MKNISYYLSILLFCACSPNETSTQNSTKEKSTEKKVDLSNFNVVEVYFSAPSLSPPNQMVINCIVTPQLITYEYEMGNKKIEDFVLKEFEKNIEKSNDVDFFKWYKATLSIKIDMKDWNSLINIINLDGINVKKPQITESVDGEESGGFAVFRDNDTLINMNSYYGNFTKQIFEKSKEIFGWAEQYLLKNKDKVIKSHSSNIYD